MKRCVLVTGANGFIGSATVAALEFADYLVLRGVRENRKHPMDVLIDLNCPESIIRLRREVKVDAIVHLATKVGWGVTSDVLFTPNILATGILAEMARDWGAKMVFASAAIVCGVNSTTISPDSPVCPDTPYGFSKYLGEQLILASGAPYAILRFSGVFGAHGPSHLGLNRAIDAARLGVPPKITGSGCARRNYIYVKDAANAIVSVLDRDIEGTHFVAGSEVLSIAQMLNALCRFFHPGQLPEQMDGPEASDQIVEPSPFLPATRTFDQALSDLASIK